MLWWTLLKLNWKLKSRYSYSRGVAATELGNLKHKMAVKPLIAALNDENYNVRERAAWALGKTGDARAIEPLINVLMGSEWNVCQAAAEALTALNYHPPDKTQRAIMFASSEQWDKLVELGADAVEPLIAALRDHYKDREKVIEVMAKIADLPAVEVLIAALNDSDQSLRGEAAKALGNVGEARAIEPLIGTLNDSYWNTRAAAAEALGKLCDERTVEPLITTLKDSDKYVRKAAAEALGKIGDARAIEPLIAALNDSYWNTRAAAAEALGKLCDERTVEPLITTLKDSDNEVRREAAEALGEIGAESPEVKQALSDYPGELLDRLWHAEDGSQVRSLVASMSPEETNEVVASIDLANVPLNAFYTESFNFKGLDDRMVATMHLAFRLLETGKPSALESLLDKTTGRFQEKLSIGPSRKGPSFESKDPWLIGEDLMMKMHTLAIELLKKSDPKFDRYAVSILETLLLDYPERLESRFWLAATWHNLYLQDKNPENKKHALRAIDSFLVAAEGQSDYQSNIEALRKLRSSEY